MTERGFDRPTNVGQSGDGGSGAADGSGVDDSRAVDGPADGGPADGSRDDGGQADVTVARMLCHDLRNPPHVAGARLELARHDCDSEHLDAVADALDRMETPVDDVVTLARTGEMVEDPEPVDLAEVCTACWDDVRTVDATLVVEADRTIRADRSRLRQLLANLLGNAVEHGDDDVTVTVGGLVDRDGFYVEDDGSGITPDERDRVFDLGYATSAAGTGFGLYIVREIGRAHGRDVRVTCGSDGGARSEIAGVDTE